MEFWKEPHEILIVRNMFLKGLAIIYLIANISLYSQIQGLIGDEGLYPVKNFVSKLEENYKDLFNFFNFPTIILFSRYINPILVTFFPSLSSSSPEENTVHLICFLSIIISLGIIINIKSLNNCFGFFALWFFYLSIYLVGQHFINHTWDTLLLETGFLAIFFSPYNSDNLNKVTNANQLIYYLIRFLTFRFTFSNGVGKILSGCQFWANFEALTHWILSSPFPTSFGFYLIDINSMNVKRVIVALGYAIEVNLTYDRYSPHFYLST